MKSTMKMLEIQFMVDHPSLSKTELQSLLGGDPDEAWEVGATYRPSVNAGEQRYQFSRWAIKETAPSVDDLQAALTRIIRRIEPLEKSVQDLPSEARKCLAIFLNETDTVLGFGVGLEVVECLSRVGACVEVSLVIRAG